MGFLSELSPWAVPLGCPSGLSPLGCPFVFSLRAVPLGCPSGLPLWAVHLDCPFKFSLWAVLLGCSFGLSLWAVPLSCPFGFSPWAVSLGCSLRAVPLGCPSGPFLWFSLWTVPWAVPPGCPSGLPPWAVHLDFPSGLSPWAVPPGCPSGLSQRFETFWTGWQGFSFRLAFGQRSGWGAREGEWPPRSWLASWTGWPAGWPGLGRLAGLGRLLGQLAWATLPAGWPGLGWSQPPLDHGSRGVPPTDGPKRLPIDKRQIAESTPWAWPAGPGQAGSSRAAVDP